MGRDKFEYIMQLAPYGWSMMLTLTRFAIITDKASTGSFHL